MQEKLAGIVAVNTLPHNNLISKYGQLWEDRPGGLSGNYKQYRDLATKHIAYIYTQTKGKIAIIGSGGINNVDSTLEKIRAGASLIQILTGLYSEGLSLPRKINMGIVEYLEKERVKNIKNIIGVDAERITKNV